MAKVFTSGKEALGSIPVYPKVCYVRGENPMGQIEFQCFTMIHAPDHPKAMSHDDEAGGYKTGYVLFFGVGESKRLARMDLDLVIKEQLNAN